MSNAEISAYSLIAAGVFLLVVGIIGVSRRGKAKDDAFQQTLDELDALPNEYRASELHRRSEKRWEAAL